MKNHRCCGWTLLLALLLCVACEKPITTDPEEDDLYLVDDDGNYIGDDDEYAEPGDGDGGTNDTDGSDDEGDDSSDGSSDNSSEDFEEDSTKTDDRDTPYVEGGVVDGNEPSEGGTAYASGDTITVGQFLAATSAKLTYVKGYIVGCCDRSIKKADFSEPFVSGSNLLLADSPEERDTTKVMSVELKSNSEIREMLDLTEHPEMQGRKILVAGYPSIYLGIPGLKDIKDFKIYM